MEQNKQAYALAMNSAQDFDAIVDEWMKRGEPWKSMDRNEARRVIAGLFILADQKIPEGVDSCHIECSPADLEEAKRLFDEAEAQGLAPFGIPILPQNRNSA